MGMTRLLGLLVCSGAVEAAALDWPIYRGPDHSGISQEKGWSVTWPKNGPAILWKANVGIGFSSFAVADGRAITMGNEDGTDTVYCFDAVSGKELWSHSYDAELDPKFYEGGPGATPTIDGDWVYTISKWGDVVCFAAKTGKIRWQRQLESEEQTVVMDWGFGGAPFPYGKLLLLNVGTAGMALDKSTGKTVWKSETGEAGYSTPYPFQWQGRQLFVFSSGNSYSGVDPRDGKAVWEATWYTRYGVNAADPIVNGDELFVSSGYSKGAAKFKMLEGEPGEVWRARQFRNQFNSSVLIGGHLYGFDGDNNSRAKLKCLNWKSGEEIWEEDGIGFGSVTAAGGNLIVLSPKGELMVAPASTEGFKPVAKAKVVDGKCWTVPVLANGLIYCRNAAGDLVCVDVRAKK
jgi:outer membrane protein assembly factor BamB